MKKGIKTSIGTLMAMSGIAIHAWLWIGAETTGQGLQLGVKLLGVPIPAMMPVVAGFGLIVFGLVIGYGSNKPVAKH